MTLFKKSPGFFILLVAVSSWRPFSQMFYSCNEHFECLFFVGAGVFSFLNILILNWPSDSYSAAMIPKISILSKVYVLILQWLMCWLGNLLVASSVLINSPRVSFDINSFNAITFFFFFANLNLWLARRVCGSTHLIFNLFLAVAYLKWEVHLHIYIISDQVWVGSNWNIPKPYVDIYFHRLIDKVKMTTLTNVFNLPIVLHTICSLSFETIWKRFSAGLAKLCL